MFRTPVPLASLCLLLSLLSSRAAAQSSPDPALFVYGVEINGVLQPDEVFLFMPDTYLGGTWLNFNGNTLFGWGTYTWDPFAGTFDYVNESADGGGNQTGTYTWLDGAWVRTQSSHPGAPPMALIPQ